jgi:hypothetical protein
MLGAARHPSMPPKAVAAKTTLTMQRLLRQAAWGCAAAAALFVAVLSGRSDIGAQRAAQAFGYLNSQSSEVPKHQFDAEAATRQLAGAIRGLNEDRDRLTKRLATLERDMDDTTGSIKRQIDSTQTTATTQNPAPWPIDAPPVPMMPADIAAMVKSTAPTPGSRPATTASVSMPADEAPYSPPPYAVDVGNASSMKGLQARWTGLLTAHPQLFAGLQPLVSLRENPRTSRAELHLVVGPFSNAEAATQLCSTLGTFRTACQPTMFDGSRLALQ